MTKLKFMLIFLLTFSTAAVFAQGAEKKVSKIEAGTVLTADDIAFLNMVANPKTEVFENADKITDATISGKKFKAGQKLSKKDAASLNTAISNYAKKYPGIKGNEEPKEPGSEGLGLDKKQYCPYPYRIYWEKYWWCDAWGNCAWYTRWICVL